MVIGLVSVTAYYGQAKAQTISGNEVMAAYECSQSYAVGSCPVISDDWSGTLVNPSPNLIGGIPAIWKLLGTNADTCGLPATYLLNLPSSAGDGTLGQVGGTNEPPYVPLGQQVKGVITYGSLVYAYTSETYTIADGCSGNGLATSVGGPPQGTITYTSGGTKLVILGTGLSYDFSNVNLYFAVLIGGAYLTILGFLLRFGYILGGEFAEPVRKASDE